MNRTGRLTMAAMFLAVMLVLGWVESLFALGPIPGIKIGLSNSVLLLSLYWLGIPVSLGLMAAKVALSNLLFGSLYTAYFGLAGGALSMLGMVGMIYLIRGVSPVGAGVAGGVLHNVGQVLLAMLILETVSLLYYMAVLVFVGAVMGGVTGSVAAALRRFLPPARRKRFGFTGDAAGGAKGPGSEA